MLSQFVLILLLAGRTPAPRQTPREAVDAAMADALSEAPQGGREPSEILQAHEHAESPQSPSQPHVPRAPWWIYFTVAGTALVMIDIIARLLSAKNKHHSNIELSIQNDTPMSSSVPRTATEYIGQLGGEAQIPKSSGETRTPEQCYAIYIEGVKSLVQRMTWPETVRTSEIPGDPPEMRWRAWLGDRPWEHETLMRATGRSQAMALKSLLRVYRNNGGEWISHAVRKTVVKQITAVAEGGT